MASSYVKTRKSLSLDFCQTLIGRKEELRRIKDFLVGNLKLEKSGSLYVSGAPGTGKTVSMKTALKQIEVEYEIDSIFMNCMELTSPGSFYKILYSKLNACTTTVKRADSKFKSLNQLEQVLRSSKKIMILCVDEIDQLKTKDMDILYNIFTWPKICDKLILIGIANAYDLIESVLPKLRMEQANMLPKRLKFEPYTKDQVAEILRFRVADVLSVPAIEICARKVSATYGGDIRRALDICKLAVDMIDSGKYKDQKLIQPKEITETIKLYESSRCSSSDQILHALPLQQKVFLATVLKLSTNRASTSLSNVFTKNEIYSTYKSICSGVKYPVMSANDFDQVFKTFVDLQILKKSSKRAHSRSLASEKFELIVDQCRAKEALKCDPLLSAILQ